MDAKITHKLWLLSVRPSSLPPFNPSFPCSHFFFLFFFFNARLEWRPQSASEGVIVFVQQPLREGLNSEQFLLLCFVIQTPVATFFLGFFGSSSSWVSNSVALHSSSYTCCSSRDTLEAHLDVFYCPHHFTTASCSFHCTSSVIQLVVRSSVCVWYTISLSLALLLFSLWEHHYHVKYIFILLWHKWMY